jgi:hypothetical protein
MRRSAQLPAAIFPQWVGNFIFGCARWIAHVLG